MANYFQSPEDLQEWVRSRSTGDEAASELLGMIEGNEEFKDIPNDEQDITDTCRSIFDDQDGNASEILFGVLAQHGITKLTKQAKTMKRKAQTSAQGSRQRNKWNRVIDGFNEGTPWRVGRDKYYDFTHYYIDEIKFDEDPNHIYSGESIWRTYVMDKFYRDYKDKDGKVVGGYINDRFHVFPTAGTPANPDVPRDQGNQMELADGERTRQPRPHEYSTERRLEEARGNKTKSITVAAESFNRVIKVASLNNLEEARKDKIYNIFKDTIEMREAGIEYETMIDAISSHYEASVFGVAQIDKVAQKLVAKHEGVGYEATIKKAATLAEALEGVGNGALKVTDPNGAYAVLGGDTNQRVYLDEGTTFAAVPNLQNVFEITDNPVNSNLVGSRVSFANMDFEVNSQPYIQEAANELGLNEEEIMEVHDAIQQEQSQGAGSGEGDDFAITEVQS